MKALILINDPTYGIGRLYNAERMVKRACCY